MRTTRFWKSLDQLTAAATEAREWRARLGPEWPVGGPLLRPTGTLATSIACPSPGGAGCPRRVVRHDDGSIRAVCGESLRICDGLDLARDDIVILGLDRPRLIRAVAVALSLSERRAAPAAGAVTEIGTHDVLAGRGFPVFLVVPGPWFGDGIEPFAELAAVSGPRVLLIPTRRSLGAAASRYLDTLGVTRFALADILVADDRHRLATSQPVDDLFAKLRAAVRDTSTPTVAARGWKLPPDARWGEVSMRFRDREVIQVRFRGVTRPMEPDQLGMKSAKDGKPTRQWRLLWLLAAFRGELPRELPPKVLDRVPEFKRGYRRQKELLARSLIECFGIRDNPLPLEGDSFKASFVINADDLKQGRQGQHERNFADHA
jgi:hypothetical protein